MTANGVWTQAVLANIRVKAGEIVQFNVWMHVGAGGALYLDDAQLSPAAQLASQLLNGGFESDFASWLGVGPGKTTTSDVHAGSKAAVFSSPSAFKNYLYQDVRGLSAGSYSASVWYKRLGSVKWAQLGVKVRNPATGAVSYEKNVAMTANGVWTQAVLTNIPVKAGEIVQFNVWMDIGVGGALYLDDAQLR